MFWIENSVTSICDARYRIAYSLIHEVGGKTTEHKEDESACYEQTLEGYEQNIRTPKASILFK